MTEVSCSSSGDDFIAAIEAQLAEARRHDGDHEDSALAYSLQLREALVCAQVWQSCRYLTLSNAAEATQKDGFVGASQPSFGM